MNTIKVAKNLDKYLTRITPFGFSGAALVSKNGKIILNKGYGMAIKEKNIPNNADTVFCIGSITKQFTAAAIMRLEMQNRLKTTDKLGKYFENVPKNKQEITLHHLLTHTAGIIENTGDDYEPVSREEVVKRALESPLLFSPGKNYAYSNAGYSLLAAIIEIVSNQSYEKFLHEQLFKPARMTFTGYRLPSWEEKVVAEWYLNQVNNGNSLQKAFPYWNLMGNGGILSTTLDMFKWYKALKGEDILSAEAKKKLFTPFLQNYAYGWSVTKTEYGTVIAHDGGNDLGASADFRWCVDHDLLVILFSNQSDGQASVTSKIRDKIVKIVFGEIVVAPPVIRETSGSNFEKFKGMYKLPTGGYFIVSVEHDEFRLIPKGQDAINWIFQLERNDYLESLNDKGATICKAAVKGDYVLFEEVLEDKSTFERKRRFIDSVLKKTSFGKFKEVEVVGTFPFSRQQSALETVMRLKFEHGSFLLGLIWHGEKLWGIPTDVDYPDMILKPLSQHAFAGYNLALARTAKIFFDVELGRLIFDADGKNVVAVKF